MQNKLKKPAFRGKTILVTGCAGFIGWKVSHLLLEMKKNVIGVDNINDYYDPSLKQWRLRSLKKYSGFTFHKVDIGNYGRLKKVFSDNKIDAQFAIRVLLPGKILNPCVSNPRASISRRH